MPATTVLVVDSSLRITPYLLGYRWDGAVRVKPAAETGSLPYVVLVDAELLYWRRIGAGPAHRQAGEALLALAPENFPFGSDPTTTYAIGEKEGGACFYALPDEVRCRLPVKEEGIQAILPVEHADLPDVLAEAVERWFQRGKSADLATHPITPRHWLRAVLAMAFLGTMAGVALLFANTSFAEHRLRAKLLLQQTEIDRLQQQYQAVRKMEMGEKWVEQFRRKPGVLAVELLADLLQTIPEKHAIRKLEFKDGKLHIEGEGAALKGWLLSHGFEEKDIVLIDLPTMKQFKADREWRSATSAPPAKGEPGTGGEKEKEEKGEKGEKKGEKDEKSEKAGQAPAPAP